MSSSPADPLKFLLALLYWQCSVVKHKKTPEVLEAFAKINCIPILIPGGCTGYVQPLDVAINKPLKDLIMEFAEVHYDNNIAQWNVNKYTVGRRRIMLSHWVGDAWIKFHEFHQDTIIKLFRQVGLSLAVDGSEGAELKIKDLPDIEIGDWEEDLELPEQMIIDDLYMSEPEYIFADEEVDLGSSGARRHR